MKTEYRIPRESREFVGGVSVLVDNTPVTNFKLALVADRTRPIETDWVTPVEVEGKFGLIVGPDTVHSLLPGSYVLWVRYESVTERVVLDDVGAVYVY